MVQRISEAYGGNEIHDLLKSKVIILWGSNPSEATPQNWHFIMEAKKAGATLICIDPNYTVAASRSDIHVTIRPGTDNALVMAMINTVIENNWLDTEFIKKATVGPFLVKASDGKFLRNSDLGVEPTTTTNPATGAEVKVDPFIVRDAEGNFGTIEDIADPVYEGSYEVEGISVTCAYTLFIETCKEWTVERASELCDIPVETIRNITEIYATQGPSTIYDGLGPDHYVNGHKVYFTQCGLAALTGNMAKEGAFCGYEWNIAGSMNYTIPAYVIPKTDLVSRTLPSPQLPDIVKNKTLEGAPIELRSLYIWVSNPLANQTDRKAWLEMFDSLDLVVVADITLGDTANYADIVLPVVHWFESSEIMPMTSPYLVYQNQILDAPFECKTDVEIVNLLAAAMGFDEGFDYTQDGYLEATMTNPSAEAKGLTFAQLQEEQLVRAFSTPDTYIHGKDGVFPTATRRMQFYLETPTPHVMYGQTIDVAKERITYWEPPAEAWPVSVGGFEANPLAEKYPIIFTTERNKMTCHTQWTHCSWMTELYPEPTIKIHPDDASARGIADGDHVRAFNDRGDAVFKASINPGSRPGVVIAPKGWQEDQFKQGHYSNLTSRTYNPACPNNCYYDALIQIEKAQV